MVESEKGNRQAWLKGLLATLVVAIVASGTAPWWWPSSHSDSTGSSGSSTARSIGTTVPSVDSTTTTANALGCVLTISDPFAEITDQPSHSIGSGRKVPPGQYQPIDSRQVDWAGRLERWFQISADGHVGWIVDNTILIDSKSAACP